MRKVQLFVETNGMKLPIGFVEYNEEIVDAGKHMISFTHANGGKEVGEAHLILQSTADIFSMFGGPR